MTKQNLLALSFDEMDQWMGEIKWKPYRADQILSWIYHRHAGAIAEMTDLSLSDRSFLAQAAKLRHPQVRTRCPSSDGTEKFLLELEDGVRIETVLIPETKRLTLCVSTQAGCTLDCTFCRTATLPLQRNLKTDEIMGQVLAVQREHPERAISHIVFMGMGEPLANLSAVTETIRRMVSPRGLGISPRRITVSTAGLVPQIKAFLAEPVCANLSVSLNATTDAVRNQIMPKANRLYPLPVLLGALKKIPLPSRRQITFEYVLLRDINDSAQDARRLIRLVHGIRCKINLIPFNEFAGSPFRRPEEERIAQFRDILERGGLVTLLRKNRGGDVLAACGQLCGRESTSCSSE